MLSTLPNAIAQEYIGSDKAKYFVVHLHGMDTGKPSPQETQVMVM